MKIQKNIKLSDYTTFKLGGIASYFIEVETKEELEEAVALAKKQKLVIFVIGEGSDILVSDRNFEAVVIKLINKKIKFMDNEVISDAGVIWDDLVKVCVEKNMGGMECLSGIPGTVGAAPVQNIGAYGQELKDTLVKVEVYDIEKGEFIFLQNKDCDFSYRESIFKKPEYKSRYIIFRVFFELKRDGKPNVTYESLKKYLQDNKITDLTLMKVRKAVLEIRNSKLENPKDIPNAGSFFKNPIVTLKEYEDLKRKFPDMPSFSDGDKVKIFAGWLIDKCGWKGKKINDIGVSNRNALVLVNYGKGNATDLLKLVSQITNSVIDKFGIKLEPEVQLINF